MGPGYFDRRRSQYAVPARYPPLADTRAFCSVGRHVMAYLGARYGALRQGHDRGFGRHPGPIAAAGGDLPHRTDNGKLCSVMGLCLNANFECNRTIMKSQAQARHFF